MPVHLAESKQRRTFRQQMAELMELFDSFTCGICYAKYHDTLNYPNVICQNFHIICSNCLRDVRTIQKSNNCPYCKYNLLTKPIKYNKLFPIKDFAMSIKSLQENLSEKTREITSLMFNITQITKRNQAAKFKHTLLEFEISELNKQIQKLKQQNKSLTEQLRNERRQFSKELLQQANQLIIKYSTSWIKDKLLSQAQNLRKLSQAKKQLSQQFQQAQYWLKKQITCVIESWNEAQQQNKSGNQKQTKEISEKGQNLVQVNKITQNQNSCEKHSFFEKDLVAQKLEQLTIRKYVGCIIKQKILL